MTMQRPLIRIWNSEYPVQVGLLKETAEDQVTDKQREAYESLKKTGLPQTGMNELQDFMKENGFPFSGDILPDWLQPKLVLIPRENPTHYQLILDNKKDLDGDVFVEFADGKVRRILFDRDLEEE